MQGTYNKRGPNLSLCVLSLLSPDGSHAPRQPLSYQKHKIENNNQQNYQRRHSVRRKIVEWLLLRGKIRRRKEGSVYTSTTRSLSSLLPPFTGVAAPSRTRNMPPFPTAHPASLSLTCLQYSPSHLSTFQGNAILVDVHLSWSTTHFACTK